MKEKDRLKFSRSSVNFSKDIIYQIVTDRFFNGCPSYNPKGELYDESRRNKKKYFGGDWIGIIEKLNANYFTELGVTSLWISQPVENIFTPINDLVGSTSYHGYWARDFKRTNPFFGTFEDFQTLIKTAHAKDIKVIMDFAPNHTSPALHNDATYAENGRLYDDGLLLAGYDNDYNHYFHHNGGSDFEEYEDGVYRNLFDLADLNHQNIVIDLYFKEAIKLWLDQGIDGIRVDAVKHMSYGWQKSWLNSIYNHRPVFIFGEWYINPNEYDHRNIHFANNSGMSLLDFSFAHKVREVFRDGIDSIYGLHKMIEETYQTYNDANNLVTFIDNHDMDRFHMNGQSKRGIEQSLVFLLTSRGIPSIYYGTEQYMVGNGDPNNRGQMESFDVNTDNFKIIQALSSLRRLNNALPYGTTKERYITDNLYVYERCFGSDVVLIALNRNLTEGYEIKDVKTALPSRKYKDILEGLLDGEVITVENNSINSLWLGPGSVHVWHHKGVNSLPLIGTVGHKMTMVGQIICIDGCGFTSKKGSVFFEEEEAEVISWSHTSIQVKVPVVNDGKYGITVVTDKGTRSNIYKHVEVLNKKQVCIRFVIENGYEIPESEVFIMGNTYSLGDMNPCKAVGPFFNQIMYQFPTGYFDISVPADTLLEFKFIRRVNKKLLIEGGENHRYQTPMFGTGEVVVKWQTAEKTILVET
ncbi:alpha-amylase family glycosyl hydrolase [Bacillus toyonensis]|uniref:alpha-amylase family glycosyl hydrolase n=1 Tax=Bacillus toyonensis TaxID=155322 RepID=UPI002E23C5A0|nr:alpha-amylase family glycosyl hydrolase [Bacillus toyonensis]MED3484591.1 alpha-amylase family glycosyl hydrolase [Bacillus toyonensis]